MVSVVNVLAGEGALFAARGFYIFLFFVMLVNFLWKGK